MNAFKAIGTAALALASWSAGAAAIVPTYTQFGPLPAATFGGSGIPNTSVAIFTNSDLTLGLSASARYANPTVTDNGAGRFTASTGIDTGSPSPTDPYGKWNFNFYINDSNSTAAPNFNYRLYYDFTAAAGNDISTHGEVSIIGGNPAFGPYPYQNSYNLGMDFLATTAPFLGIKAPSGSFNPSANGEYTFALVAYEKTGLAGTGFGSEVGRVGIEVNAVPEPSAVALAFVALGGLAAVTRSRKA